MEKELEKFTVKRSEWLRGEGSEASFLIRPRDDKKCCVGFFALQVIGLGEFDLFGARRLVLEETPPTLRFTIETIYSVNDSRLFGQDRETALKELFRAAGYEVEFVD